MPVMYLQKMRPIKPPHLQPAPNPNFI